MYAANFAPTRVPVADLAVIRVRRPARFASRRLRKLALGLGSFLFMAVVLAQSAHGSSTSGWESLTVQPGQTLWSIAAERYPGSDTRTKVGEIMEANHLGGGMITAGEVLRVPSS